MNLKFRFLSSLNIFLVIYPSITLFLYLFGPQLVDLPFYHLTFLITICLVPWIVFVGVPFVDRVLRLVSARDRA